MTQTRWRRAGVPTATPRPRRPATSRHGTRSRPPSGSASPARRPTPTRRDHRDPTGPRHHPSQMVWPVRGCGVGACGPSGDHDPRSTGHDRRAVLMLTTLANVVATRQAVSRVGNPPRRLAARLRPWGDAPGVRARLDDVELRLLAQLPSRLSVDQIAGDLRIPAREAEHPDPLRVPELGVRRRCGGVRARIAAPDQPPALAAHMTSPPFGRPHAWRNGPTRQAVIDFVRRTCGGDGSAPCRSRNGSRSSTTMAPVGARSRGRPQTRRYRRMDRCRHERPDNRLLTTRTGPALAVAAAHLIALGPPGPSSPRIRPRGKDAPVGWAGASSSSAR